MSETWRQGGYDVEIRTIIQLRIDGEIVDDEFVSLQAARKEATNIIRAKQNAEERTAKE